MRAPPEVRSFFDGQEEYDEKARKVLEGAAISAVQKPWAPFRLVGVALWDGYLFVLAVQKPGNA
jgi:hypothetical protein